MACQAGKDVYVEKPICVAVEEGKKMVEAARKYKRVVQVGLWQRSNVHFQKAVQLVQDGLIGKVTYVRTWNYSNIYPEGIGNPAGFRPAFGLDWDMWLGPAPKVAFNWNRFGVGDRWSTFRYFYDYANGWPGDWMIHLIDIVQWAMKVDGPHTVTALGRKFYLTDNSDTPDTLQITLEYPEFVATYENRLCNDAREDRARLRNRVLRHGRNHVCGPGCLPSFPARQRRGGKARGKTAEMKNAKGGRRPGKPRGQHAGVHEDSQNAAKRH